MREAMVSWGQPLVACQTRFGAQSRSAIPNAAQVHPARTSPVRLLVAAAEAARIDPAPGGAAAGMPVLDASIGPDGRTLTVGFVGARPSSRIPCGADYFGYPVESANAVGVVITTRAYARPATCTADGHRRGVTVRLAAPLAGRSVLELQGGTAVLLTTRR
jgi:hypothetical protein